MKNKKLELEWHGTPVNCQELQWPPKQEQELKKDKWQSIDINQEVYNKLEAYRSEWSADNLSEVINEFISYFEADNPDENDNYCCNCGDYHD